MPRRSAAWAGGEGLPLRASTGTKSSLTLPLSALHPVAIPGEATRTPQLTIGQHHRSPKGAEKILIERSVSLL